MTEKQRPRCLRDLNLARIEGEDVSDDDIRVLRREDELCRAAIAYPRALLHAGIVPSMFEGADYGIFWQAAQRVSERGVGDAALNQDSVLSEMRRVDEKRFFGAAGMIWISALANQSLVDIEYAMEVLAKELTARHQLRIWKHRTERLNEQIDRTRDVIGLHAEYITESIGISLSPDGGSVGQTPEDTPWDENNSTNYNIIPTGWEKVDRAAGGGHGRGDLGIIGGGTNAGKSYAAQRYLRNQARLKRSVLYISVEDPLELMYCRMLADFSRPKVRPIEIRQRRADPMVIAEAKRAMRDEFQGNVRWVAKKKAKASEVCDLIRRHRFMAGIDSVVVDYLQAIQPDHPTNSKTADTSYVVSDLKRCFEDCQVAGWVLSQYSREEYKDGAEPSINACKYAGDIENESEVMLLLWRDAENDLHAKIPKVKWGQSKGLRYIIKTDDVGCFQQWEDDFEEPKKKDDKPRGGGGGRRGGYGGGNGNGGGHHH